MHFQTPEQWTAVWQTEPCSPALDAGTPAGDQVANPPDAYRIGESAGTQGGSQVDNRPSFSGLRGALSTSSSAAFDNGSGGDTHRAPSFLKMRSSILSEDIEMSDSDDSDGDVGGGSDGSGSMELDALGDDDDEDETQTETGFDEDEIRTEIDVGASYLAAGQPDVESQHATLPFARLPREVNRASQSPKGDPLPFLNAESFLIPNPVLEKPRRGRGSSQPIPAQIAPFRALSIDSLAIQDARNLPSRDPPAIIEPSHGSPIWAPLPIGHLQPGGAGNFLPLAFGAFDSSASHGLAFASFQKPGLGADRGAAALKQGVWEPLPIELGSGGQATALKGGGSLMQVDVPHRQRRPSPLHWEPVPVETFVRDKAGLVQLHAQPPLGVMDIDRSQTESESIGTRRMDSFSARSEGMDVGGYASEDEKEGFTIKQWASGVRSEGMDLGDSSSEDEEEDFSSERWAEPATKKDIALAIRGVRDLIRPQAQGPSSSLPTPSPSPRKRTCAPQHRSSTTLDVQRRIREAVFQLMRREPRAPLTALQMPTTFEANLYGKTRNPADGPTLEPLRIDIATSSVASLWNKRAADLVSTHLCHEPGSSNLDHKLVARSTMTHFTALRRQYIQGLQSTSSERDRQDGIDQSRRLARTTRHRALLRRRANACLSHKGDPGMDQITSLWETMPVEVMSGDETDHHRGEVRYVVVKYEWRNRELDDWLRTFDLLHLSTRFTADGRATRGKFPRPRIRNTARPARTGNPVSGLPENFYDPNWLAGLQPYERDELDIQPPIDLSFTPFITRRAARFTHVTNANTPPLAQNHPSLPAPTGPATSSRHT